MTVEPRPRGGERCRAAELCSPVMEEERYTLAQAAGLTGLTPQALARRIERGSLPAVKVDRRRFVTLRDLAAAGLLDPATRARPRWANDRLDSATLARELVAELSARGLRIFELERRVDELTARTEAEQRELDEAKRERIDLNRALEQVTLPPARGPDAASRAARGRSSARGLRPPRRRRRGRPARAAARATRPPPARGDAPSPARRPRGGGRSRGRRAP